jgi:hypothetical protein
MQTQEFLSAVLPPPGHGYYCAVELTTSRKEHRFVETIGELEDVTRQFDAAERETYFAVSTFEKGVGRTAANSAYMRCLFADVDCGEGKPYTSAKEGLAGLSQWLTDTGFPNPFVVASGFGLHLYWTFTTPIPTGAWRNLAESFKRASADKAFHIDYSVSADSARVLRVPGTTNRKHGTRKPVRILLTGDTHPAETYAELLSHWKEEKASLAKVAALDPLLDSAPVYAQTPNKHKTELEEISQCNFDKIVELGEDGCAQVNDYIVNATRDGIEPLFRSVISIAKYCVDGLQKAEELGALHPYSLDRIHRKFESIKGPHNCKTFETQSPGTCSACKHYGKIHNPISLGRELKPQAPLQLAAPVATTTTTPTPTSTPFPDPPEGYALSQKGVAISLVDAEGVPRFQLLADTPFFASVTYDRVGERFVQFAYFEHGVEKSTVMPLATVTARDESIKAFSKIGIVVANGHEAGFRTYLKATVAEAKKNPPLLMPTSLGWQADDSFAFNGNLYTHAGVANVPMHGFDNINETLGVSGTLDGWRLVVASIMRLERWDIVSMMAISFGAPLMRFTGLNGLTFHLCGNDSGKGKTLCQRLASSVWGVPDKFRTTPNTSPIAMVNRLGMLGSLPLMVDEITHRGRADAEWFPEFLSQMSDGRGKDRMESQTNTERRNTTTWSTLALMTSNKHMLDYLTAERDHSSEGEIRRLLEITFDKDLNLDEVSKSLLFDTLPNNYGLAGEAYAKWLVANVDTARNVVKNTYTEVFNNFEASGDERFWIAGCACILAGVRLAGKRYADVVNIPEGKIAAFLLGVVENMRLETSRMKRNALDVLNEFTKRNYGKLVMVDNRVAKIAGIEIAETLDRRDLCGRVEKGKTDGWVEYYIGEKEIKSFCSSLSYGYTEFKRDLSKDGPIGFTMRNILAGTRGPVLAIRCLHVRQRTHTALSLFSAGEEGEEAA